MFASTRYVLKGELLATMSITRIPFEAITRNSKGYAPGLTGHEYFGSTN